VAPADLESVEHVVGIIRKNYADGDHAVISGVGGVHAAVAIGEADFPLDAGAEFALDGGCIQDDVSAGSGLKAMFEMCRRRFGRDSD
jgi:hypothetical protein